MDRRPEGNHFQIWVSGADQTAFESGVQYFPGRAVTGNGLVHAFKVAQQGGIRVRGPAGIARFNGAFDAGKVEMGAYSVGQRVARCVRE